MSRLRWPDSTNSVSEKPGTIHSVLKDAFGKLFVSVCRLTLYNVVRSHAGVLADGVTPFNNELEFSGIGSQALTVSLKYHFYTNHACSRQRAVGRRTSPTTRSSASCWR